MPAEISATRAGRGRKPAFEQHEMAHLMPIIDAVCGELGVTAREIARRRAVTERVLTAYRHGRQLPLNMVDAGLREQL